MPGATAPRRVRGATAAAEMRDAILDAARELYRAGGYSGVTMRAIAEQLGMRAPSLYHHFVSKEAIFLALEEQMLALLVERVEGELDDPLENLRQYFWRYYQFSRSHADHFTLTWVDQSTPPMARLFPSRSINRLTEMAHRRLRRCVDAGIVAPGINIPNVSNVLWSAMLGVAVLHLHQPGDVSDALATETLNTVIAGLRRR